MPTANSFLIDPSSLEEKASQVVGTFAFSVDKGEVEEDSMQQSALLAANVLGALSPDGLQDLLQVAWAASKQISAFHRLAAEKYLADGI